MTNENKNNGNRRAMDLVRYSLQRDISKKAAKGVPTTEFKEYMKKRNNSDKGILIGSTIPLVISVGGAVLGVVTYWVSDVTNVLLLNSNSAFLSNVANSSFDLVRNMGVLSAFNLAVPAATAIGINFKLKSKTERYNYRLYTKKELEELKKDERVIEFVQDIKTDKDDKTLEFTKNFLTNTNISGNTKDYNKELFIKLSEHREKLLQEEPLDESLEGVREFLKKSKTTDGASEIFLESPIVQELIETQKAKESGRKLIKKN